MERYFTRRTTRRITVHQNTQDYMTSIRSCIIDGHVGSVYIEKERYICFMRLSIVQYPVCFLTG